MRSPLDDGPWLFLDAVSSTQDVAASLLASPELPGIVFADHQECGRGRFGRSWQSAKGDSLTMSLVFASYASHARPWLLGMAVSIAVAKSIGAQVRWPNDVVIRGRKVAGVLTELLPAGEGYKVPVVGIGVNLGPTSLPPELSGTATSLFAEQGRHYEARALALNLVEAIVAMPEPDSWSSIAAEWLAIDATVGKTYRLPTGCEAVAVRVDDQGALVCVCDGAEQTVMAADAIFGA